MVSCYLCNLRFLLACFVWVFVTLFVGSRFGFCDVLEARLIACILGLGGFPPLLWWLAVGGDCSWLPAAFGCVDCVLVSGVCLLWVIILGIVLEC